MPKEADCQSGALLTQRKGSGRGDLHSRILRKRLVLSRFSAVGPHFKRLERKNGFPDNERRTFARIGWSGYNMMEVLMRDGEEKQEI
jgi:hypothetical protein